MTFADHHRYRRDDVARDRAKSCASAGAMRSFTTDKDAVRLEALGAAAVPAVSRAAARRVRSGRDALFESVDERCCA